MAEETVPNLYRLAFIPGCFRCPKCGFQLSKQTISPSGIGCTEADRESGPCPNDGTPMVHVTYREQLESYATRLHEELDLKDELCAALKEQREWTTSRPCQSPVMNPCHCRKCKDARADAVLAKVGGRAA